jgi:hypothetical protein
VGKLLKRVSFKTFTKLTGYKHAIFLKKIGSGTHSDPKFGWRGVSCIDAR